MSGGPLQPPDGKHAIVLVRLEALKAAIEARSWDQAEWEFDRVLRAFQKASGMR